MRMLMREVYGMMGGARLPAGQRQGEQLFAIITCARLLYYFEADYATARVDTVSFPFPRAPSFLHTRRVTRVKLRHYIAFIPATSHTLKAARASKFRYMASAKRY